MAVVPETRDNYHFEDPDHHHTNEDRLFLQLRKVRGRRSSGTPQPSLAPLSAVPHSDALICLAGDYTHVCWPPPMPPTASGSMDECVREGCGLPQRAGPPPSPVACAARWHQSHHGSRSESQRRLGAGRSWLNRSCQARWGWLGYQVPAGGALLVAGTSSRASLVTR